MFRIFSCRWVASVVLAPLLWLSGLSATAQYRVARKRVVDISSLRESQASNGRSLPQSGILRLAPLAQHDLSSRGAGSTESRVLRFAVARDLSLSTAQGEWLQDASGHSLWRLRIISPGAQSVSLQLTHYRLPVGGAIYCYGKNGRVHGAFTEQHNTDSGILTIAPIEGDEITIEYEPPRGMMGSATLPFVLAKLYHDYIGAFGARAIANINDGEPFFDYKNALAQLSCAPNTLQFPEYSREARGVLMLVFGGQVMGSGVLINNLRGDGTPYVLTAAHNINMIYAHSDYAVLNDGSLTQAQRQDSLRKVRAYREEAVRSMVAFFGFESPLRVGDIRGSEEKALSGAEIVAYDEMSDMCLLRITGLPEDNNGQRRIPDAYNPYFCGWSISERPSAPYYGIHHPIASTKRYSEAEDQSLSLIDYYLSDLYAPSWTQKHWLIKRWSLGTTAVGSSGSPLFSRGGYVIGGLSGGLSTCRSPIQDKYYSIRQAWGGSSATTDASRYLSPWLDPDNKGLEQCEGYDPEAERPVQRISIFYGRELAPEGLVYLDGKLQVRGVGNIVTFPEGEHEILGAYLVFKGNQELQQSFPSLSLGLAPRSSARGVAPIWETELNSALYTHYDTDRGHFAQLDRSIARDTIELFVPTATQTSVVEGGDYLLYCKSAAERELLSLPLLAKRSTASDRVETQTSDASGQWSTGLGGGGFWIDLLVRSRADLSQTALAKSIDTPLSLYYYGHRIYIHSSHVGEGQALLYAMDGRLVASSSFGRGETVWELPYSLATGVYIAQIKVGDRSEVLKFIYTP